MTVDTYNNKLKDIISLPQFEKVLPKWKNEKHPLLKGEEQVVDILENFRDTNQISETLFDKLKPIGSKPPRLYGLAKVHKENTPLRPVLSMPGSSYYKIGKQVADWLSVVQECRINASTKSISESLNDIELENDEVLISFDVSSLYTKAPVREAINHCAELLVSGKYPKPPVSKEVFIELATIRSCNVLMLTHDGYYLQIDGLEMGSPPAPHIANGSLSKFDKNEKGDANCERSTTTILI